MARTLADMTPEEAQQWADMADDVPGYHDQPASRAYRTIANMSKEWGIEYTGINHSNQHAIFFPGEESKDQAEFEFRSMSRKGMNPRVIHRYVSGVIDHE